MNYYIQLSKDLWIALRALSLTLALASTTTGIIVAYKEGFDVSPLVALLVTLAGVAAQSGANLINDYFEGSFRYNRNSPQVHKFLGAMRSKFDILVFLLGIASFGIAGLIGLYLFYITNIHMLIIGLAGIIGGYAYTGEPFVYKRRGLGVPLSFMVMGPLMVYGAYFVFAQSFSWTVILYSLPISFLIPALMLSNELRDFTRDSGLSLGTLSVRIGSKWSKHVYSGLLIGCYTVPVLLILMNMLSLWALVLFVTLPLAKSAYKSVSTYQGLGIPKTNRLHLVFSILYITTLALM